MLAAITLEVVAYLLAPHSARKQLVTLRKITDGHSARFLIEEFARRCVATILMKAPQGDTAEDQLLVVSLPNMSGRRSSNDPAAPSVTGPAEIRSMFSAAPYGYRYVRKRDDGAADMKASTPRPTSFVRTVYQSYIGAGMSIGAITRLLNKRGVPTSKQGKIAQHRSNGGPLSAQDIQAPRLR